MRDGPSVVSVPEPTGGPEAVRVTTGASPPTVVVGTLPPRRPIAPGRASSLSFRHKPHQAERLAGGWQPGSTPRPNEGFAIAPATYCVDGLKPVYWADDGETDGYSIRSGTLPCAAIAGPPPALADFPIAALPAGGLALIGAEFVARRRRRWVVQPQT
jgi:hypothetical protein